MGGHQQPTTYHDSGVQHERTALAWERTAIAMMVAGVVLARYAATDLHFTIAVLGIVQVGAGGGLLLWAGFRYDELHGPLREGVDIVHPRAARIVGLTTLAFTSLALILALLELPGRL